MARNLTAPIDPDKVPPTKPAYVQLHVDSDGNLWVRPSVTREEHGTLFDVFSANASYLGRLDIPFQLSTRVPHVITREFFYAVVLGDFDVEYVYRFRIVRPPGP